MNGVPIKYVQEFVADSATVFETLWKELAWVRRDQTPRSEYYCNDSGLPYTYGRGAGVRTYEAQPWHPVITAIREGAEKIAGCRFEVCFLNGYRDGSDQLGWHADDSPEMDDERPIAIVSLGARREIYFAPAIKTTAMGETTLTTVKPDTTNVTKLWLDSGSLCLMEAGMQDTHFHRIPKSSIQNCGPRVSLTFRGLSV